MIEVVAALIWKNERFMICRRPAHKARGLLWEFVGGKVEAGESREEALVRECREELGVTVGVGECFMQVLHEYPDLTVHLTVFHAEILSGTPQLLEHHDLRWITPEEIPQYDFCPADVEILEKILCESGKTAKGANMFEKVSENLKKRGFEVSCFATAKEANAYLNTVIDQKSVGIGGSMTVAEMGLYDLLSTHNAVYWHQAAPTREESFAVREAAGQAELYISSVNGLAESGEIINIDGYCNRVASILHGHQRVYLIVGKNKLAENYDAALWRARNIAAPLNAKRLEKATPCVAGGRCFDCNSPQRICRGLSVLWNKPTSCEMEVVLIAEDLGY